MKIINCLCVIALTIGFVGCDKKEAKVQRIVSPDTPKQIEKPAEDKATKPAGPAMKVSDLKSPWKHSKIGYWAEFNPHYGQSKLVRHEIIKIHPDNIEFNIIDKASGKLISNSSVSMEVANKFNDPKKLDAVTELKEVVLKIGGKDIKAIHFKRKKGASSTETWISMDMPLNGGVIKSIQNGKLQLELVDFNIAN